MLWLWSCGLFLQLTFPPSIAVSLASHLDLNDLDALALTCRPVHHNLTQFAHQLKARSLRCARDWPTVHESSAQSSHDVDTEEPIIDISIYSHSQISATPQPQIMPTNVQGSYVPQISQSSKISPTRGNSCARDLVGSCRNCGTVVCRNCAIKPPTTAWLKDRHRRLCKTCTEAPFEAHLQPLSSSNESTDTYMHSSASSTKSARSLSSSSSSSAHADVDGPHLHEQQKLCFTSPAFLRGPCTCASRGVYLCVPCGQSLRAADTTYKRVWTWRSRYSMHIGGGLGTGLGQGNQGQKCGRGEDCLENSGKAVCWVEIDCSENVARDQIREGEGDHASHLATPDHSSNKPGYFQQEIECIRGLVKKKVRRKVKVGETVWEFEDERVSGKYLDREAQGILRSWCGWCGRVCPGEKDRQSQLFADVG